MKENKIYICHLLLFCFHKGLSSGQARLEICSVYGEEVLTERTCQRWYSNFRSSRFDLNDRPKTGRPCETNIDALRTIVENDPRLTSYQIAEELNQSQSTIIRQLHKIGKVNRAGIWVPHDLSQQNLSERILICTSLLLAKRTLTFWIELLLEMKSGLFTLI